MATTVKPIKPSTTLDFEKVFAANAPSAPFIWTDSEYIQGWDVIQNTPPTRQQFNALQGHSDEKENFLYGQYLEGYVDKFLDYLDTIKAPLNSPDFTGTPKINGTPIGYGVNEYSYEPWYFYIGDYYIVQYAEAATDSSGIAKLQLPISVKARPDGHGEFICLPSVGTSSPTAFSFGIGNIPPYSTPDGAWIVVRSGETGQLMPNVMVGALFWGVPA